MNVPLAWRNLTGDKKKLMLALTGITFAVVLMFTQVGFRNSMIDSPLEVIRALEGDLFLISPTKYRMHTRDTFPRSRLHQALAAPGVTAVAPVYMRYSVPWKHPRTGRSSNIRVIAFDPDRPTLRLAGVRELAEELKRPHTLLLDTKTRAWMGTGGRGLTTELARQDVTVVGNFTLGTDFRVNGTAIMSDRNFLELFPSRGDSPVLDRVEIGCLTLADPARVASVQAGLTRRLPADVVVVTLDEFLAIERSYWTANSAIGPIFNLGLAVGFIVGLLICYQILFSDLLEQRPQFATLKAIGYRNSALVRTVVAQAFLLGLIGFVPAVIVSAAIYELIAQLTGLKMVMERGPVTQLFVLTIVMCVVSGRVAVRKVLATDPAEVF